jgi:LEA14-like dessication related protein
MVNIQTRRAVVAAVVIVVIVLAIIAGSSYVQTSMQSMTVQLKDRPSVSFGQDDITVLLTFELRNPSLLSGEIVALPFSIELSDYPLGSGNVSVPFALPAGGSVEITGRLQIPYSLMSSAAVAALKQYLELGTITYRIQGTAGFKILFFQLDTPFEFRGDVFELLKYDASTGACLSQGKDEINIPAFEGR